MRTVLLLMFVLFFYTTVVLAQAGSVGIFSDEGGTSCNLPKPAPGYNWYHVVYVNTSGATAVQFRAKLPACLWPNYWYLDASPWAVQGYSQTGIFVPLGECLAGPILTVSICVRRSSEYPPISDCCAWYVDADPHVLSGLIEAWDCDGNTMYPTGSPGILGANSSCPCGAVPVEETTWGAVKALYAE